MCPYSSTVSTEMQKESRSKLRSDKTGRCQELQYLMHLRIIGAGVTYKPLHASNHILPCWMESRIALVVRQDNHILLCNRNDD